MGKVVTLGETHVAIVHRAGTRIDSSERFAAHYGGGEANVAISLANYGHEAIFATKVPDNALGKAVKKHLQCYGVDTKQVLSGGSRLGTYYMETGSGERAASVIYDRAGSSFAEMDHLEWSLEELFQGIDIFHVSGITPALSKNGKMTKQVIEAAKSWLPDQLRYQLSWKIMDTARSQRSNPSAFTFSRYLLSWKMDALYLLGIEKAPEAEEQPLIYYYQKCRKSSRIFRCFIRPSVPFIQQVKMN